MYSAWLLLRVPVCLLVNESAAWPTPWAGYQLHFSDNKYSRSQASAYITWLDSKGGQTYLVTRTKQYNISYHNGEHCDG